METRLHNILRITNVTEFIKTILESTCKVLRSIYFGGPKTSRLFFNSRWILNNFWYLDCYNFCYIFRKIAKLYFLQASHRSLKTSQKSYPEGPPLQRNCPFKIWKICLLWRFLFQKRKKLTSWIFYQANISTNVYHFWKFDIHGSTIVETTGRQSCYIVSFTTAYRYLITDKGKQQQTH